MQFTHLYYLHCVRSLSWCATTLATLMFIIHYKEREKMIWIPCIKNNFERNKLLSVCLCASTLKVHSFHQNDFTTYFWICFGHLWILSECNGLCFNDAENIHKEYHVQVFNSNEIFEPFRIFTKVHSSGMAFFWLERGVLLLFGNWIHIYRNLKYFFHVGNISSKTYYINKEEKNHKSWSTWRFSLEIYFPNLFAHWIDACAYDIRWGYENTAGKEMIKNPI